jgi:threonylcarbamoyladenosine tRNA methylthiotransferase MtaB
MRRRYKTALYAERIATIKQLMPHCCIGVDVIVGFPGETREDFMDTYNFLNGLDISYLHVFTYSERDNTPAAEMPGSVPGSTRFDRNKMLHILSEKKRRSFYESQLNKTEQVLFERETKDGYMHGFTPNYVKVKVKYDPMWVNELKDVFLTNISPDGDVEITDVQELVVH